MHIKLVSCQSKAGKQIYNAEGKQAALLPQAIFYLTWAYFTLAGSFYFLWELLDCLHSLCSLCYLKLIGLLLCKAEDTVYLLLEFTYANT